MSFARHWYYVTGAAVAGVIGWYLDGVRGIIFVGIGIVIGVATHEKGRHG